MSEDLSSNRNSSFLRRMAVVTSGYLPVPNVLGGAVEALDMMMIRENEKTPNFEFTVFSSWVPDVDEIVREGDFQHADFHFIKTPALVKIADHCIYWVAKYILRKKKLMSYRYIAQRLWYIRMVAQALAQEDDNGDAQYDDVLIENHATLFMTLKQRDNARRYAGHVYYHLHNEVLNDFGCLKEMSSVKKVLGVSRYIVDTFDQFLQKKGMPRLREDQKAVWHNCVDTGKYNTQEAKNKGNELRRRYGFTSDDTVFLFSGRLTPEKGAVELLRAFTEVAEKNSKVKLIIVGSFFFKSNIVSPFERQLRLLAENPIVKDKIVFTGYIKYEDMPAIYSMADICVLPSIWDDPAPLAVIESLAAKKPLITTQSGGIPEYVDARSALILNRGPNLVKDISNAMTRLVEDTALRMCMEQHSFATAKKLTSESYFMRLVELLK